MTASTRKRILLPMDFRPGSLETFREAMDLARACGGRITLLHAVVQGEEWSIPFDVASQNAFHRFSDIVEANGPALVSDRFLIRAGCPSAVILDAARDLRADMIVLRGERSAWKRARGGSVITRLARHGPCPVCVIPWSSSHAPPRDAEEQRACEDGAALERLALLFLVAALLVRGLGGLSESAGQETMWSMAALWCSALVVLGLAQRRRRQLLRRPGEARQAALAAQRSGTGVPEGDVIVPLGLGSEPGRAVSLVEMLVAGPDAKALFLYTAEPSQSWARGGEGSASQAFTMFRELLVSEAWGRVATGFVIRTGHPGAEFVRAVHELSAAHLVLLWDDAGVTPATRRSLLRCSPCPVWLVPTAGTGPRSSSAGGH